MSVAFTKEQDYESQAADLPDRHTGKVVFGGSVTFVRDDGREQTFRIVGEDEADPAEGRVSYVSPLARAVMGKEVGDTAMVAGHEVEITAVG